MLKQTLSVTKIVLLALVLSFGLSYALAWTSPTATPPGANVAAPINASATDQVKTGGLTVGSLTTAGLTNTGTLRVTSGAGATKVLTSDASGNATWQAPAAGGGIDPAPIGSIVSYAGAAAPSGYLLCNGAAVSRTTYAALFAAIGTTYGVGNGSTTFNLPDLRGEFVRGLDNGRGVDSGRALGSAQAQAIQSHNHNVPVGYRPDWLGNGTWAGTGVVYPGYNTASATAGGAETRPRNVALNYIIKAVNNSEMVLVVGAPVTSLTAGTGVTLSPVGPNATGDITITSTRTRLTAGTGITLSPAGPNVTGDVTISAAAAQGLGIGQTWQNVKASRAFGVTYTNTTANPIFVSLAVFGNNGGSMATMYVNGIWVGETGGATLALRDQLSAVVPAGSTYLVTNNSNATIDAWAELR